MYWAYYALANFGYRHDSKATGVVRSEALWNDGFALKQRLENAKFMQQQIKNGVKIV
ncbi:MAG: hypothetical protein ACJAQS_000405 [Porticoccus sp.]|jgi:hypothetical protein|uniref:hypothetical protein n=1 Tax=Shewanella sp. CAL98-MNA-CIBAN-0140 TaxID=3140462 RepID=UPI0026BA3FDA